MRELLVVLIWLLGILLGISLAMLTGKACAADLFEQARTSILITPVACPQKSLCNVFHARYVRTDGVVEFSRDIPSAWMASSVSIEVRTGKGTIRIWSDR